MRFRKLAVVVVAASARSSCFATSRGRVTAGWASSSSRTTRTTPIRSLRRTLTTPLTHFKPLESLILGLKTGLN